jgi:ferritin-like metal-binding protein YciE
MPIKDQKELFIWLLSGLRQATQRSAKIFQELCEIAQDPEIKEALDARVFVSGKIMSTLDECFRVIGQKPVNTTGRLHEVFAEDFRRELTEIESWEGRRLFVLAEVTRMVHLRIAEYQVLIAAADLAGHYGVGVMLESCLADNMVFVERTRQLIRNRLEQPLAA